RESGREFTFTEERVKQELKQEGLSRCDKDRLETTARCGGKPRRVVALKREAFDGIVIEEAVTGCHQESPLSGDGSSGAELNHGNELEAVSRSVTTITTS